ncbi:MAG: DEAD/DEAH box helicase [Bacteroidota bacterium]
MSTFNNLGLSEPILKAIAELGFKTPSEIQEQSIPKLINGHNDFIGLAQTGTGKTAAFGLPLVQRIDPTSPHTQALILAPTRELGQQIAQQLALFSKYLPQVNTLAVYGGAPIVGQLRALRKPQQVIIATPGRLIDLIRRKAVKLGQLQFLVLDEADEMLNMGFKEDLDTILSHIPTEKNTWLFSATMSDDISRIVKTYMDAPLEVRLNRKNEVNVNIKHQYALVRRANKTDALTRFLDIEPEMRGVVFCRTKRDTQQLAEDLLQKNYKADAIHGDLSQRQRDAVMNRFKRHDLQVLVATDVAARGIDVNDITHVFHFTLPDDVSYYTHRSGRTARAGKKGTSIAFVNGREQYKINRLIKQLAINFTQVRIPDAHSIYETKVENWCLQVLEQRTKGKLDQTLLDRANLLFGSLSKEELTAKLLMMELDKQLLNSANDLNETPPKNKKDWGRGRNGRSGRSGYPKKGRRGPNRNKFSKKKRK